MISAPSEMRCRSMPTIDITGKTIARVSGMAIATTEPARTPSARKLTARTMTIACHSELVKSVIA